MKTRNKIFLTTYLGVGLILSEIAIQEINDYHKDGMKVKRWSSAHIQTALTWPISIMEGSVRSLRREFLKGEPIKSPHLSSVKDNAK